MDLIDRYLAAVKSYLPQKQHDVVAELADEILSTIEERQTGLARPLTPAEVEGVIREHGHPMVVAGRYLPRQYLIGPDLFPTYWYTLRTAIWVVLLVWVGVASLEFLTTGRWVQTMAHLYWRLIQWTLLVVGSVTITFAVLDSKRVKLRFLTDWNPAALPAVDDGQVISRAESLVGIVWHLAFLLWWLGFIPISVGAPPPFALSPLWQALSPAIVGWMLLVLAQLTVDLIRPWWTPLRGYVNLLTKALAFVVLYLLLQGGDLVVAADVNHPTPREQVESLVRLLNWVAKGILVGAGVMCAVTSVQDVRRLVRKHTSVVHTVSGGSVV
jgi:hypothetical protein